MIPRIIILIYFITSLNAMGSTAIQDATGLPVDSKLARRIVSLAPSITEIVAHFLKQDGETNLARIVGVSNYSDFPEEMKKIEKVGPYVKINIEKVVALQPDLILATKDGNSFPQIEQLRGLGKNVVVVSTLSLEEIRDSIRIIGSAMGSKNGERLSNKFFSDLTLTAKAVRKLQGSQPQSAMVQVGFNPIVVAGGASFVNEVFSLIGYRNVFEDSTMNYPKPSREEVLRRNPDHIFVMNFAGNRAHAKDAVSQWMPFKKLNAVRNNSVIIIDGDDWVRPTFRMIDAVKRFETVLRKLSKKG